MLQQPGSADAGMPGEAHPRHVRRAAEERQHLWETCATARLALPQLRHTLSSIKSSAN